MMKTWHGLALLGIIAYLVEQQLQAVPLSDSTDFSFPDFSLPDLTDMNAQELKQQPNIAAFLWAIRSAEGTATVNDEGYRALFGWRPGNGKTFASFATHPAQFFTYTDLSNKTVRTSAAGAYQITKTTFDALCNKYAEFASRDFSPATQDAMAMKLIAERGALTDALDGNFAVAIAKCAPIWASLPGSTAHQPTRTLEQLAAIYEAAGGTLA